MNNSRLVAIILVILLGLGWYISISGNVTQSSDYSKYVAQGDEQFEKDLYQKAYNSYVAASKLKMTKNIQKKIVLAYESYYKEFESYDNYKRLAKVYEEAYTNYPSNKDYWISAIELEIKYDGFEQAMDIYDDAISNKVKKKDLNDLYKNLLYSYKERTVMYNDFINEVNGYYVLQKGLKWQYQTADLEEESDNYSMMSPISVSDNNILYLAKDFEGTSYFLDGDSVINGKIKNLDITDSKLFKEDKVAVNISGSKWSYIDIDGNVISKGYDNASNYCNGKAVVYQNNSWKLIDEKAKTLSKNSFEDIKLSTGGDYLFGKIAIAKANGKYGFYDETLSKKTNDFACDDIDIIFNDELVAYKSNNKWGFVDTNGKVVIEPQYENARSFSNGLAAVSKDGKWGFINLDNEVVVDFIFLDAQYVSSKGTVLVSNEQGLYNFITFNFYERIANK